MITEVRWNQIQAIRKYNKKKPKRRHEGYEDHFMSQNVAFCGECDCKVKPKIKDESKKNSGKIRFCYICYWKNTHEKELKIAGRKRCILKQVDANLVDELIFDEIVEFLSNPARFAEKWLKDLNIEELQAKRNKLKAQIKSLEKDLANAYELIVNTRDEQLKNGHMVKYKQDDQQLIDLRNKLDKVENDYSISSNKIDIFAEFQAAVEKADYFTIDDIYDPAQNQFKNYLYNLPFKEKKRIVEAVIAPENGGKCLIRYQRANDYLDESDLENISFEDQIKPQIDKPITVDLFFRADFNRIGQIISSLDRNKLLSKFYSFRAAGRLYGLGRWRRFFG